MYIYFPPILLVVRNIDEVAKSPLSKIVALYWLFSVAELEAENYNKKDERLFYLVVSIKVEIWTCIPYT